MWLDFIPAAALFGQNDSDSKIIREAWHGFIIVEKISAPQLAGCKLFWELQNSLGVCWWFGLAQKKKKIMNTQTQHSRSLCNLPGLLIKHIYLASMLDEEPDCPIQPASFSAFQTLDILTYTHTLTQRNLQMCQAIWLFALVSLFIFTFSQALKCLLNKGKIFIGWYFVTRPAIMLYHLWEGSVVNALNYMMLWMRLSSSTRRRAGT